MTKNDFHNLLKYYRDALSLVDTLHFNSETAREVYAKHVDTSSSKVVHISHSTLLDNRVRRVFSSPTLRMIFIGNTTPYKGFALLEEVLCEIYNMGHRNWRLEVWGARGKSRCELIDFRGSYSDDRLHDIFHTDSLLITPSLWAETFSLTTLEALSFGTPTLVSSTVGARDIVRSYDSWFIFNGREELKRKLLHLLYNHNTLRRFNHSILNKAWGHSIDRHAHEIIKLYM